MSTQPAGERHVAADLTVTHETRLFLAAGAAGVQELNQHLCAALARGETQAPALAGQRFVLVDWYVRLVGGRPEVVVSETRSWIVFDQRGQEQLHRHRHLGLLADGGDPGGHDAGVPDPLPGAVPEDGHLAAGLLRRQRASAGHGALKEATDMTTPQKLRVGVTARRTDGHGSAAIAAFSRAAR
jgi:hypothetical protein